MNLEDKIFYRLVKVLYFILLAISAAGCLFLAWIFGGSAILWSVIVFAVLYAILGILKEAVVYVAFGKSFSWDWIFILNNK